MMLCLAVSQLQAQDYTFSNHNIVPFSLNPALAGNANALRLGLNYRMQWPALGNKYNTARVSYDQNIYRQMSSIGIAVTRDDMAGGIYCTNEFNVAYSHTIKVGDEQFVRLGLQGGFFANFLNYNNLTFEDQYDSRWQQVLPGGTLESFENTSRLFPDFTFGAAFVIQNKFSFGGSVCHLTEPRNGFADIDANILRRKFVLHANFLQDFRGSHGLIGRHGDLSANHFFANASYQQQQDFKLLNVGAGFSYDPLLLGVSFKDDLKLKDIYTVSFMLGGQYKGFQLYYIQRHYS